MEESSEGCKGGTLISLLGLIKASLAGQPLLSVWVWLERPSSQQGIFASPGSSESLVPRLHICLAAVHVALWCLRICPARFQAGSRYIIN